MEKGTKDDRRDINGPLLRSMPILLVMYAEGVEQRAELDGAATVEAVNAVKQSAYACFSQTMRQDWYYSYKLRGFS